MDAVIQDDFKEFVTEETLFNSEVILYSDSIGGTSVFEGNGIYDKKPNLIENESGQFVYQGHKSFLTLSMDDLTFMSAYFSLKGYFVEITDNQGSKDYQIVNSMFNSNANNIFCELKEIT